jgi:hypothetical protein
VLNLWHSTVVGNFACLLHVRIKHARGGNITYIYMFDNSKEKKGHRKQKQSIRSKGVIDQAWLKETKIVVRV